MSDFQLVPYILTKPAVHVHLRPTVAVAPGPLLCHVFSTVSSVLMALARPSEVVNLSSGSDGEQLPQSLNLAKRRSGSHSSGYSRRRSHSLDLPSSAQVPDFSPLPDSGAPLLPSWRPYARARGGVPVQPNHADGQEASELGDIGLNGCVPTELWTLSAQGGRKRRRRTEGTIKPAREEEVDMSDPHRLNPSSAVEFRAIETDEVDGRGVQKDVVGGVWNTLGEDELRTCEEWLAEVDCPRKGGAEAERHREGVPVGEGLQEVKEMGECEGPQCEGIKKSREVEAVVNAGDGGTEGGSDSDSDCCMLEGDPNKEEDGGGGGEEEDDGEILVTGEKGPVACRDFPHARHNCAAHPFGKSVHQTHCPMCHCFVCDVVAPCESWGDHCHASDADKKWNADRAQKKREEKLVSLGLPSAPPPPSQIERLFHAHMQRAVMKLVSQGNKFAVPEMRGGEGPESSEAIRTRAPAAEPSWSWPAGGGVGRPEAGPHPGLCWNRVGTNGGSGGGGAPEHLQPCPVGAGGSQQWVTAALEGVGDSSGSAAPAPPLPHWVEVNGMNRQIPVQEPVPQPPPPPQPEPYDPFSFQPPFPLASAPMYGAPINSYQSWQPRPPPSPSLGPHVQFLLGGTPPPPSHHSHPQAYTSPPPRPHPLSRNLLPTGQRADVGGYPPRVGGSDGAGVANESASLAASNGYGNVAFRQQHASLSKGGGGVEPGWQIEGGQWQPRRTWGAGGARWGGT